MTQQLPLGPLMIDIAGTQLAPDERERLLHPLVGGVIFFTRNFADIEQMAALATEIARLRDPALLLAVDHEGGRVQRFRAGFTRLPAAGRIGAAFDADATAGLKLAEACGLVMAQELRAIGIDFSFAPVLDLDRGISRVIGDRSFHAEPAAVARLAQAYIKGMQRAGMAAVGKHFPGHGGVEADSHVAAPVDTRDFDTIWAEDVRPFAALAPALAGIMPAHVVYARVDANPAGFSRVWLGDMLRSRLGYQGVIFSDDLSMAGARVAGDVLSATRAALQAGCDMGLVCNDPQAAVQVLEGLEEASLGVDISRRAGRFARMRGGGAGSARERLTDAAYRHARDLVLAVVA